MDDNKKHDLVKRQERLQNLERTRNTYRDKLDMAGATPKQKSRLEEMFNQKRKKILENSQKQIGDLDKLNQGKGLIVRGNPNVSETLKIDPNTVSKLRGDLSKPNKMNALRKLVKASTKGAKMVAGPVVGLASSLLAGNAEAAASDLVPGGLEGVGPKKGSLEAIVEDPSVPLEKRIEILEKLSKQR